MSRNNRSHQSNDLANEEFSYEKQPSTFYGDPTDIIGDITSNSEPTESTHLVGEYELSVDTSTLEIHKAQDLFHPIVFSHFYQNLAKAIGGSNNDRDIRQSVYSSVFEKIVSEFKVLDEQFVKSTSQNIEQQVSTARRLSIAPEHNENENDQGYILTKEFSNKSANNLIMGRDEHIGGVNITGSQSKKRIERAKQLLQLYFHGCFALLNSDQRQIPTKYCSFNSRGIIIFVAEDQAQFAIDVKLSSVQSAVEFEESESLFRPVGSTLIQIRVKETSNRRQGVQWASLLSKSMLGQELGQVILTDLNLLDKRYILVAKESSRPQLRHMKKYRTDLLNFQNNRSPDSFIDRFTHEINSEKHHVKWLDIIAVCKNVRYPADDDPRSHCFITIAIVGMSSNCYIPDKESLHQELWSQLCLRMSKKGLELASHNRKAVISQVQSSCGFFLPDNSTWMGSNYNATFALDKKSFYRMLDVETNERLLNCLKQIHQSCPIAIPIYCTVPPLDDPLPLPFMVTFNPGGLGGLPFDDGKITLDRISACRSGLCGWSVGQPKYELSDSTYLEREDTAATNAAIDCINVDFQSRMVLPLCDLEDFIVCFAASHDGQFVAAVTFHSKLYIAIISDDENSRFQVISEMHIDIPMSAAPCGLCLHPLKYENNQLIVFIAYDNGAIITIGLPTNYEVVAGISPTVLSNDRRILYVYQPQAENDIVIDISVLRSYDQYNLIIGGKDGKVYVLQATNNNNLPTLKRFTDAEEGCKHTDDVISSIAVSRTAGLVAAGGTDGAVKLWQVDTRNLSASESDGSVGSFYISNKLFELKPHRTAVTALTFSLSGSILYVGGADGRIVIWDTIMGMHLRTIFEAYSLPCRLFEPRAAPITEESMDNRYNWIAAECCFHKPLDTHLRKIKNLSISPDSSLLTIVFQSGHVVFLDAHVKHLAFADDDLRSISHHQISGSKKSSVTEISENIVSSRDDGVCIENGIAGESSITSTTLLLSDNEIGRNSKIQNIVMMKDRCIVGRHGFIQILNLREGTEESLFQIRDREMIRPKPVGLIGSADHRILLAVFDNQIYSLPSFDLSRPSGMKFEEWSPSKASTANSPIISRPTSSVHSNTAIKLIDSYRKAHIAQCCIPLHDCKAKLTCYALEQFTGKDIAFVRSHREKQYDEIYCYAYGGHPDNLDSTLQFFGTNVCGNECLHLSHNYGLATTISVASHEGGKAIRVVVGTSSGSVVSYVIYCTDNKFEPPQSLQLLQKHLSLVTCSTIAENGNIVITGSSDRTIIVLDAKEPDKTKQRLHVLQHDSRVTCLTVCPKTGILIAGCSGDTTLLWFWRTGSFLGVLQTDDDVISMHPHDDVTALAYSECEQVLITTSSDGSRVKFHFNAMSKDFQRIHSLAAAKQHGLIRRDHFSGLPLDTRRILAFIEHHSVDEVREFCKSNPREVRELILLHCGRLLSKTAIDDMPLAQQGDVDGTSVFTILGDYDRIKDKLRFIFELVPHGVILTLSKHGDLIDTLLHKQKSKNSQITKQSVVDLLNFYSFLLGTPAKDVDLNIDEAYWLHSRRSSFSPYLGENQEGLSDLEPFSEHVNINKIINLCDTEPLLFANFVKTLRPCRNYDSMRSPFSRKRTRIDLSCNYLLRGSNNRVQERFWEEYRESKDLTACDVVVPYFIPLKGIAGLRSHFLSQVIRYSEDYSDFSLFRNPVVRMVIEFKWQSFARGRFQLDFIILFLWNGCVVVNALLMRQYSHQYGKDEGFNQDLETVMVILRVVICLVLLRFLARELLELVGSIQAEYKNREVRKKMRNLVDSFRAILTGTMRYFFTISNVIDLSLYSLVIIGIIYQSWALRSPTMNYKEYSDSTFAVAMPFLALNLLSDMAVHDRFGSYVAMMVVMIRASMGVLIILSLMILSFAAAFMLSGVEPSAYPHSFYYFDKALLTVYSYVFGGLSFVDMLNAESPKISVILLVIFRFLVSIVLLNILIGIMATSQNQIMSYGAEAVLLAKANYIVTYENVTVDIPDWLLPPAEERMGCFSTCPHGCILEKAHNIRENYRNTMLPVMDQTVNSPHCGDKEDASLADMIAASDAFSMEMLGKDIRKGPFEEIMNYLKDWVASWSFAGFLHRCLDVLLFLCCSGAAIDPAKKKQQFPEYIQILNKDGIDFNTATAKVFRQWK